MTEWNIYNRASTAEGIKDQIIPSLVTVTAHAALPPSLWYVYYHKLLTAITCRVQTPPWYDCHTASDPAIPVTNSQLTHADKYFT